MSNPLDRVFHVSDLKSSIFPGQSFFWLSILISISFLFFSLLFFFFMAHLVFLKLTNPDLWPILLKLEICTVHMLLASLFFSLLYKLTLPRVNCNELSTTYILVKISPCLSPIFSVFFSFFFFLKEAFLNSVWTIFQSHILQ